MAEGSAARNEKDTPKDSRREAWGVSRGGERVHLKGDVPRLAVQVQMDKMGISLSRLGTRKSDNNTIPKFWRIINKTALAMMRCISIKD